MKIFAAFALLLCPAFAIAHDNVTTFEVVVSDNDGISTNAVQDLPEGFVGQNYAVRLKPNFGTGPYEFRLTDGQFPPELSLTLVDGILSGKFAPSSKGTTFVFSVKIKDSQGTEVTQVFSLKVSNDVLMIDSNSFTAVEGRHFEGTISAKGGEAPYRFQLEGKLPNGVSHANGKLSGIPSLESGSIAGTVYKFKVRVVDKRGRTSLFQDLALSVGVTAPVLSAPALLSTTVGAVYQDFFSTRGGRPPYTYHVVAGALPVGFVLTGDGTHAGRIEGSSSFVTKCPDATFAVIAIDAVGQSSTQNSTCIEVLPDLLK